MYIRTDLTRKDLTAALLAEAPLLGVRKVEASAISAKAISDGIVAIWQDDPQRIPHPPRALLIPTQEMRDTLAWLWTYVPDFRPITAVTRVLDPATFKMALELPPLPELKRTANAWLGLIFAEVAANAEGRIPTERVAYAACASTGSFVQGRALALGYSYEVIPRLALMWSEVRAIGGPGQSQAVNPTLRMAWSILHAVEVGYGREAGNELRGAPTLPVVAAVELAESGQIGANSWEALTSHRETAQEARTSPETPREERVRKFQAVAGEIANGSSIDERDAFVLAYLASQVSPGSLEHLHLLGAAGIELPATYYWYGLLAGLQKGSNLASANGGLGHRVLRELLRKTSVLDSPTVDLDYIELQVANDSTRADTLRGSFPGYLSVSLLPGVSSILRSRTGEGTRTADRSTSSRTESLQSNEVMDQLRRLERLLADTQMAYERLSRSIGYTPQLPLHYQSGSRQRK